MKWLRIFSTLIDDGEHQSDDKCHLVINVKINKNKKIEQNIEFFGYQRDWDEDSGTYLKYPFILEFAKREKVTGKINYGGWDNKSDNRINIFNKEIKINETYTFFEFADGVEREYIYRITNVSPI